MAIEHTDPRDQESLEAAERVRRERDAALTPGQRIEQAIQLIRQTQALRLAARQPER